MRRGRFRTCAAPLGATLILLACAGPLGCASPAPAVVPLGDGQSLALSLGETRRSEVETGRARFEIDSGVRVAVQTLPRAAPAPGLGRDASSVADALAARHALGDAHGELTHAPCAVLERAARCLTGWTAQDGERRLRRGAVLEVGERVVWIDVSGPDDASEDVARVAERLLATVREGSA